MPAAQTPTDLHALSTLTEAEHERLARLVMRRQAALSLRVAAIFILLLVGVPLFNYYKPETANAALFGGFTTTWLVLGVLFYPITWLLSSYFVKASDQIEAECADWRGVLGIKEGEPLEPAGVGDVKPAFIADDVTGTGEQTEKEGGR